MLSETWARLCHDMRCLFWKDDCWPDYEPHLVFGIFPLSGMWTYGDGKYFKRYSDARIWWVFANAKEGK